MHGIVWTLLRVEILLGIGGGTERDRRLWLGDHQRDGSACDQSVALRLGNAKGHAETTCLHCEDAGDDTTGTAINW